MGIHNKRFYQKYPRFTGKRSLKVVDPTILNNVSINRIVGIFKATTLKSRIFTIGVVAQEWVDLGVGNLGALRFNFQNNLTFYINSVTIDNFLDGKYHYFDLILDGINNRIIVDGITYENGDLTFQEGNSTSTAPIYTNVASITIGKQFMELSSGTFNGNYLIGELPELIMYSSDLVTPIYNVSVNGAQINASAATIWEKNETLNLPYNNSNFDIGDNIINIISNGDENYTSGRYGEYGGARKFIGTDQWDSWNNVEELEKFSISSWFKINSVDTQNFIITSDNDDGNTIYSSIDIRAVVSTTTGNTHLLISWGTPDTALSEVYSGTFINVFSLNKWHHIILKVDSTTKELFVYLDGKPLNLNEMETAGQQVIDYSKIEPFPIATISHGRRAAVSNTFSTDISIANLTIFKYLLSVEEIKTAYKKYLPLVPQDYVALWKFNANLLDEKTNYNLTGQLTQIYTTDKINTTNGAYSTANNNWASVADIDIDFGNSMTFGGWFYIDSSKIVKNGSLGAWDYSNIGNSRFLLNPYDTLNSNKPRFRVHNGTTSYTVSGVSNAQLDRWFHLVGIVRNQYLELWVNGIKDAQIPFVGNIRNAVQKFYINNAENLGNEDKNGDAMLIDEVYLYNRALTETEILGMMLERTY